MSNEVRITDPITGGQKGRKPERFALIPWEAMGYVAKVYAFGEEKYAAHNWRKGYAWSLSFDALLRHVTAPMYGEWFDPESKLPHLAHAVFHCFALIIFYMFGLGTDDRFLAHESLSAPSPVSSPSTDWVPSVGETVVYRNGTGIGIVRNKTEGGLYQVDFGGVALYYAPEELEAAP